MASFHNNSILFTLLVSISLSLSISFPDYHSISFPHHQSHSSAARRDTITQTQPLADNETLVSAGGTFALGFFTPNGSDRWYIGVWHNNKRIKSNILLLWVANRDSPITGSTGQLSVTANGTIMITNQDSNVVWYTVVTDSIGVSNPVVQLLDTGNLVVKEEGRNNTNQKYLWQSFDYPTDTLLPGMKLGVDKVTGLSRNLTAWKSEDDPSSGDYYAAMVIGNNSPEMYLFSPTRKEWRSGPWDGIQLGELKNWNSSGLDYSFVNNYKEVTFSYQASGQTILPLLQVTNSGKIHMISWSLEVDEVKLLSEFPAPANPCDKIGWCGSNAICDSTKTHVCPCPQGFTHKNQANLESIIEDSTDGCVRVVPLDCREETDTFLPVNGVKLPESSISSLDTFSLEACRSECLKNCSCTAYAFSGVGVGGGGCVIWVSDLLDVVQLYMQQDDGQDQYLYMQPDAGQDLYIRIKGSADRASHSLSPKAILAIIVSLISVALLLSCFVFFLWRRKKRERVTMGRTIFFSDKLDEDDRRKDLDLPLFNFGTIAAATESFSDENKLGQGGFGPVYKGTLGGDKEIAVKRLAKSSQQGAEEFKNEVMLIAKLQNRNLVRLLGCCIQGEERMLIYEYMPNKSLDTFLFDKEKAALLEWRIRYQIIVGITRGLLYLHHDSRYIIIHRDLKASNILLDKEMNPKISDFGMARLFGGDETDCNTRKVVGTYGYMSPEYAMEGIFSLKSDVYSFGVLLLEIISGKKNRGSYASPHLNLVAHAWSLWNEGKSLELVDEAMNNNFLSNDVLKCIKIGLLCVQDHPEDRPLMSSVIEMLGADIISLRQPKQPGFLARMDHEFDHISSSKDSRMSNQLTVTLDGR